MSDGSVREWEALADVVAAAAADRLAVDPVIVEVGERLSLADAFFIASAPTDRQVRAIAENVMDEVAAQRGVRPHRIEGREEGRWVLLDYGDLVVHVLTDEDRRFYALEKLWADGVLRRLEQGPTSIFDEVGADSVDD